MNDHKNDEDHFADSKRVRVVRSGLDLVETFHQPIDFDQSIQTHDDAAWYLEIAEQPRIKQVEIRWQRADYV